MKNALKILLLFLCIVPIQTFAQLNADFTANKAEGCNPLVVKFQDKSSGSIVKWRWIFENNGTSDSTNPSKSFTKPGTYDIKLIVFDGSNYDTILKREYITVFANPTAKFSAPAVTVGCYPFSVNLKDNSTKGTGVITHWLWDFGDGSTSNKQHPTHTYQTQGFKSVSLVITDTNGCKSLILKKDLIEVRKPPQANFTAKNNLGCNAPVKVSFTNKSTGDPPLSYYWDFGDGDNTTTKEPDHTYQSNGSYDVTLIVKTNIGCADTLKLKNLIKIAPFTAKLSVDKKVGCIYPNKDEFRFVNKSQPNPDYQSWRFGDGSSSSLANPKHIYDSSGIFTITLISGNGSCVDTAYDTVKVQQVKAAFTSDTLFSCRFPYKVNFKDVSKNAVKWNWSFGDGKTSTSQNPSYTYNGADSFKIKLLVENSLGCQDTLVKTLLIDPPKAQINKTARKGCIPLEITFGAQNNSQSTIVSYDWNFGNGTSSTKKNDKTTYTDTGVFHVRLIVTTKDGCKDTATETIRTGDKTNVVFHADTNYLCASHPIKLIYHSNFADTIEWFITNGHISNTDELNNTGTRDLYYSDTGWVDITATPFHNGCEGKAYQVKDSIYIIAPVAKYGYTVDCNDPYTFDFFDISILPERWEWDFGTGDSAFIPDTAYTFPPLPDSTFDVKLTVYNDSTGCSYSVTKKIRITIPKASFTTSDSTACHQLRDVQFDASASENVAGTKYYWDFGNGVVWDENVASNLDELIKPPKQNFDTPGVYQVKLIVWDDKNCADSMIRTITVYRHETRIGLINNRGCKPLHVQLLDSTIADAKVIDWQWDLGDSVHTDTSRNTSLTYTEPGYYIVKLTTTDSLGCIDSSDAVVSVTDPVAGFFTFVNDACEGDSILFYNVSTGGGLSFLWDFGDGDTSHSRQPKHAFTTSDSFNITLIATDTNFCADTMITKNYISINNPKVWFYGDNIFASCPPLLVDFKDTSAEQFTTWHWDFGDNSESILENPKHNYTKPDTYDVKLVVSNKKGCTDSLIKKEYIIVGGPSADYQLFPDSGCKPLEVTFIAKDQKNVSQIIWDTDDGVTAYGDTFIYSYNRFGVFKPVLIVNNGEPGSEFCEYSIPLDPVVIDTIDAQFSVNDTSLCFGDKVSFTNLSVGKITSWDWDFDNGSTSSQKDPEDISYKETKTYTVSLTAENEKGCIDSFKQDIILHPLPTVAVNGSGFICEDDELQISATENGDYNYEWFPKEGLSDPYSPYPLASPKSNTFYYVVVTDKNQCQTTSDSVTVTVQQRPKLHIFQDTTIVLGDTAAIRSVVDMPVNYYKWREADSISCLDCPDPFAYPYHTTTYHLEVQDTSECFIVEDDVTIKVIDDITIDVPGAFTPNGDGINDKIYVRGWGIDDLIDFQIYNRWGELVFETSDKNEGWDGTYKGKPQNMDTYVYKARARSISGKEKAVSGSFSLIR